jgi:hypothetical protein
MFYNDTQPFLNFLTILSRLEVGVFDRAVKLDSPCTCKVHSQFWVEDAKTEIAILCVPRPKQFDPLHHFLKN